MVKNVIKYHPMFSMFVMFRSTFYHTRFLLSLFALYWIPFNVSSVYMFRSICWPGFLLGFFRVVQHYLDCLVHHLDHNGMQLWTTWVQSKVMDGYSQICYSYVSKGCTTHQVELCIVVAFVG